MTSREPERFDTGLPPPLRVQLVMKMEQYIRAIAGTFVLMSLALGHFVDANWYWFTAFVGANLLQSAFTKWCLMEILLEKLGVAQRTPPQA